MKKQKIFLTANTYFGRKQALLSPKRSNYSSIEEMNQSMIDIWNKNISIDDSVYHLGYFAQDPHATSSVLEQLNGNIYFFNNGTDRTAPELVHLFDYIMFYEGQIFEIPLKKSVLCYYPLQIWGGDNSYHFYGDETIKTDLNKYPNRMNVSFDMWGRPISIDECIEYITDFKSVK